MKTRAWAEISREAIKTNLRAAQQWAGADTSVMAVVKADAYGHGLLPVAQASLGAGAAWLGVACAAEGVALRQAGIALPICLLCAFAPDEADALIEHALTPLVGERASLDTLVRALSRGRICAPCRPRSDRFAIHLDIDTGIGRGGVQPSEAVDLWQRAERAGLNVSGVSTHFADADNDDETLSREQEQAFARVCRLLHQAGARFRWTHAANSPATLHGYGLPTDTCHSEPGQADLAPTDPLRANSDLPRTNLVRPGLLLYGIAPFPDPLLALTPALTPALALKARVAAVRELPTGHGISYGATHRLARPSRVATVLIGYGDGYPRRLSNQGYMLLRGRRAPILGCVCMDQTVVDVTDIAGVLPGDEAVCIGAQHTDRITVEAIAALIDATPHEITTCLTARLPRVYT